MRFSTVKDYVLFKKFHEKLNQSPNTPAILRLKSCMYRTTGDTGVTVIKKGDKTGFQGISYCHNSWTCPNCAPYKLSLIKAHITSAFKMLEKDYKCVMVTYSVPHLRSFLYKGDHTTSFCNESESSSINDVPLSLMSLADVLYLLRETFNKFLMNGSFKKDRTTDFYSFSIFEITWNAKTGWHPHIHALYWVKPETFEKFQQHQNNYRKIWENTVNKTIDQMTWIPEHIRANVKQLNTNNKLDIYHKSGIFFSKASNGAIREVTQNNYFWSGENEVADLLKKKAHNGHYTHWQILERALNEADPKHNFFWNLFTEVINAVRGIQQWRFKKGFLSLIKKYEADTKDNAKVSKKKCEAAEEPARIICWLSSEQWSLLKYKYRCTYLEVILSSFAQVENSFDLICEFCDVFKVGRPLKEPPFKLKLEGINLAA